MSHFAPGLHVSGHADASAVKVTCHKPAAVKIKCAPDLRQQWAALAMATRLIDQSRAAITAYKTMELS